MPLCVDPEPARSPNAVVREAAFPAKTDARQRQAIETERAEATRWTELATHDISETNAALDEALLLIGSAELR